MSTISLDLETMPVALDVIDALIKKRTSEIREGIVERAYIVREFSESKSVDVNGRTVESPFMNIVSRDLDYANSNKDSRNVLAMQLEQKLGVPHLPQVNIGDIKTRPVKSLDDIRTRLNKMKRRAAKEVKEVRDIGAADIAEAQNPSTLGALEALNWLYNNGTGRDFHTIMLHLFRRTVIREHDKLFHVRRHPAQRPLHVSHNEQLIEEINTLHWAVNGNPLDEVAQTTHGGYLGSSRF